MMTETESTQTDLDLFKKAVKHTDSTLIEDLLYSGYKPDYTEISFSDELFPIYSICYVVPEVLDVLAKYNALPLGVSLATVKFVAFSHGNRKIVWEDFWNKANLNLSGIDGYTHPAIALATYGYSPYYRSTIHPQKHHFELLASKGALPSGVSISTLLYMAYAGGNNEIVLEDFLNKNDLNLEGVPGVISPAYLLSKRGKISDIQILIKMGLKHRPIEFLDDNGYALGYFSNQPYKSSNAALYRYKILIQSHTKQSSFSYTENYPKIFEIAEMFLQNPTSDLQISLCKFIDKVNSNLLPSMYRRNVKLKTSHFAAFFAWAAHNNKVDLFRWPIFLQMFNSDQLAARESVIVATAFVSREFLSAAIQQPSVDSATIVEACNVAAITGDNQTLQILLPFFKSEAIKSLVPAQVLIDRNLGNPLFTAIFNKQRATVNLLVDSGVITSSISDTVFKNSCLQWAISDGDAETIAILLTARDLCLNHQDAYGNTALHTAAEKGLEKIMMQLIDVGADRRLQNSQGKSALELIANLELRSDMASYQTVVKAPYVRKAETPRCRIM